MKSLKGLISFTRSTPDNIIHIRLHDELSGVDFVSIEMRPEDFALALMNSQRECEIELFNVAFVGKRREQKTEIVIMPPGSGYTEAEKAAAVKPFEVDGWMGFHYHATIGNRHYQIERDQYEVSFVRFVDVDEKGED